MRSIFWGLRGTIFQSWTLKIKLFVISTIHLKESNFRSLLSACTYISFICSKHRLRLKQSLKLGCIFASSYSRTLLLNCFYDLLWAWWTHHPVGKIVLLIGNIRFPLNRRFVRCYIGLWYIYLHQLSRIGFVFKLGLFNNRTQLIIILSNWLFLKSLNMFLFHLWRQNFSFQLIIAFSKTSCT
jgi:hypothetical protein